MARIDEIAPDLYRVSIYMPQFDLQFNHFLIKDDEPLLFHTGMRRMFPEVRDAVAQVIDPAALRWISWSHFEVDECGALNEWLTVAPRAQAICSQVGAAVNIEDFAIRPPRDSSTRRCRPLHRRWRPSTRGASPRACARSRSGTGSSCC